MTILPIPDPPLPDLDLVFVEGNAFMMGLEKEDTDSYGDEQPVHRVVVPSFYMGKYPVTQRLWKAVMGDEEHISYFEGDKRPKTNVSWDDAKLFIEKLNALAEIQAYVNNWSRPGFCFACLRRRSGSLRPGAA